ncbi:potassium channel family protein [Roseomonas chloroacetimidivorans]|uniref:potassium channel family protein n=1 Tax=Roseomonas chloroacetimidivorans TaxID=1766656 RepID=UPI003C794822
MAWLIQAAGLALVALALADIFLTVLYARSGVGLLTLRLNRGTWRLFRWVAGLVLARRNRVLSFAGPTLVALTVVVWVALLTVGFALVVWPRLGTGIQASSGPTPTDFVTALYYSGYNLTTLGLGDLAPQTAFFRLLTVLEAAVGFSVLTLSLTYLASVYGALARRNAFALLLHHQSGGTADAAELLERLGPGGDFTGARQEISRFAAELLALLEAHHAYPVLHYFRRNEPAYAMARIALTALDAASLARTVLDKKRHHAFAASAAVEALWGGGLRLLRETARDFLPSGAAAAGGHSALETDERRWRLRYEAAIRRMAATGIGVAANAESYVALRRWWDAQVRAFATDMAYSWSEIAPHEDEGAAPDETR